MRVGFIGVGNIGRPMATQIAKAGFDITVHDLHEEAAASLVELGARWADSPRTLAEHCDIICTCLPGPAEMKAVVFGEDGIAESIRPGAVYIDHTTNSPALVREVHKVLQEKGVEVLDAPVSGGMEGAQTRDLTVLVGGESETLEKCRPVLESMAKTVLHVGKIGSGSVCKITHNAASFIRSMALVECLTVGVKAGVEPDVLLDAYQRSALGSNSDIHVRLPATIFQGNFEPRFALKIANKDIGLAAELADQYDVPVQLIHACKDEMAEAMSQGLGDRDSSISLTLQEERAGVEIRV